MIEMSFWQAFSPALNLAPIFGLAAVGFGAANLSIGNDSAGGVQIIIGIAMVLLGMLVIR